MCAFSGAPAKVIVAWELGAVNEAPLVTIAIPTFNRAGTYLPEALESALAQTYPNVEIVVADNHSTDNTQAVVARYKDERVRYYRHTPALVPNGNFNFCLSAAHGEYFVLLHDDDRVDADFVDVCVNAVKHSDAGLVRTGRRIINPHGVVLHEKRNAVAGPSIAELILAWFDRKTSLYLCCTMFKTGALREIGGFHSRHNLYQDVGATLRVAAHYGRTDVEAVKASARQHMAKSTHAANVKAWCEDALDLLDLFCQLAPERREEIERKGMRYFASIGFSRANSIRSPLARLNAYLIVYRLFGHKYLPATGTVFRSTALYRGLRAAKRKALGLPAWVD